MREIPSLPTISTSSKTFPSTISQMQYTSSALQQPGKASKDLLGLPKSIRQRILRETGLLQDEAISLTYHQHWSPCLWACCCPAWDPNRHCQCLILPGPLLLSCKKLRAESLEILYGENKFRLYNTGPALSYLEKLPEAAWQQFRSLEFVCVHATFSDESQDFEETAYLWKELCSRVAAISKHRSETLTISFQLRSCISITEISELMNLTLPLRPLAGVRIAASCWGSQTGCITRKIPSLAWYGHTLVKPRSAEAGTSFAFLKLPAELRCLILYHAGLVFDEDKPRGLFLPGYGRSTDCCGECGDENTERHSKNSYCYCSRGITIFGYTLAYSKTCTCHQPRSPAVFAVNRECREEAIKIYYAYNHSFIKGTPASIEEDINCVPKDRLRYIKSLSLTFSNVPGHTDDMFGVSHHGTNFIKEGNEPEWKSIHDLIRCLETRFLAENFTLEINVHMNATIPAAIDYTVKKNLTTIFKRFWILLRISRLKRVVVNFVRYDEMRPDGVTKSMVLNSDIEGIFGRGIEKWFRGDLT